jgi:hypothetical protein
VSSVRGVGLAAAAVALLGGGSSALGAVPAGFVSSGVGDADAVEAVAVHPDGTAEAFAEHNATLFEPASAFHVLQARLVPGAASWDPPVPLAGGDTLQVVAVSRSGNVLAGRWATSTAGTQLEVAVRIGGVWGPVTGLALNGDARLAQGEGMVGAISDTGRAVLVWRPGRALSAATLDADGWSTPRTLGVPGYTISGPVLAINGRGDVALAGTATSRTRLRPRAVVGEYLHSSGRWRGLRLLAHAPGRPYSRPTDIALRDAGVAAVAVVSVGPGGGGLAFGNIHAHTWAAPRAIPGAASPIRQLAVRFDRAGRTIVAWTRDPGRAPTDTPTAGLGFVSARTQMPSGAWGRLVHFRVGQTPPSFVLVSNGTGQAAVLAQSLLFPPTNAEGIGSLRLVKLAAARGGWYRVTRQITLTRPDGRVQGGLRLALNTASRVAMGWFVASGSNAPFDAEVVAGPL